MRAAVIGAGVCGLCCATELREQGAQVTVYERGEGIGSQMCSWFAGGMLAPLCERENADEAVLVYGEQALSWWQRHTDGVTVAGSLVLAPPRDRPELKRFSQRTRGFRWVDQQAIDTLEPDLQGRFQNGLYFASEAHLNPRRALQSLASQLIEQGVNLRFNTEVEAAELEADVVLDCRGYAAKAQLGSLRGVKGEMLILSSPEFSLSRPVRLLHPRFPLYIVPREDGHFMVGATMLEQSDRRGISARSLLELLGAAYALHPILGEAEVVEIGVDVRPAFSNNLPSIRREGRVIRANGLFRHGFLLGPAVAREAARMALNPQAHSEEFLCS